MTKTTSIDGVTFELVAIEDGAGRIRMVDEDSGETITIKTHPIYITADSIYTEMVAQAQRMAS